MPTANIEAVFPATPLQQGLLYHSLLGDDGGVYVTQQVIDLRGELDVEAFRACWRRVAARRQILRSSFHWKRTEQPLLVIDREAELRIDFEDWSDADESEQRRRLDDLLQEDKRRGFRLDAAPLLRLKLIRQGPGRHRLYWANHHLILDGWSAALLASEALVAYATGDAGQEGRSGEGPEWSDYLRWLQRQDLDAARRYWRETLGDLDSPCLLDLPPGGDGSSKRHGRVSQELDPQHTAAVLALARRTGVTPAVVAQAAWAFVLSRYCGAEDVLFGSTSSGRPPEMPGVERIAGLFINTLPLRVRCRLGESVQELLRQVQRQTVEMRRFEYAPLRLALEQSSIPAGAAAFNTLVVFENYPVDQCLRQGLGGLQVTDIEVHEETNYPLSLVIAPGERMRVEAIHDRAHFSEASVGRLADAWLWTLREWTADPERRLGVVAGIGLGQRAALARQASTPAPPPLAHALIHRCIEQRARLEPDRAAAACDSREISYGRLNAAADRLAARLCALGAGPDRVVGIALERGVATLVAILAALKAGAAYWSPPPAEPQSRLRRIVRELAPCALVTSRVMAGSILASCPRVLLDFQGNVIGDSGAEGSPGPDPEPDHPAYVLYTSGSTGRPKGVQITHRGLAASTAARSAFYGEAAPTYLLLSPFSFDSSVAGIFWTLAAGGKLVVADEDERRDPELIADLINKHGVSHLLAVPSLYEAILEEAARTGCPAPAVAIVAGEECPERLVRRHFEVWPGADLVNEYGPTEGTVWATAHRCRPDEEGSPPIGRPIAGVQTLTLDAQGLPAPWGAAAELCLSGEGLARGYAGFPSATAAAFRPHPSPRSPGQRIYRTGDRVRFRDDGALEFLGRVDRQVKIRGERVELGEIERTLARAPGVREAAVETRSDGGSVALVGYVRPAEGTAPAEAELLDFLRGRLPAAMVPARLVVLERFPRNAHGKVDRKQLPPPPALERVGRRPLDPLESQLAACWRETLGRETADPDVAFFEAGGDSLSMMRLAAQIRKRLQTEVALRELLQAPTIAHQAELLRGRLGAARRSPDYERVDRDQAHPLSFAQERMWYFTRLGSAASAAYNIPVCVDLEGELNIAALEAALNRLVERHEVFRTRFESVDDEPRQRVQPAAELRLDIIDARGSTSSAADNLARDLAVRPFDLAQPPLLRVHLLEFGSNRRRLVLTMPHLIADRWSAGIIFRELAADYAALRRGERAHLTPPAVQPVDHAVRERRRAAEESGENAAAFWRHKLAGAPSVELPCDRPRLAVKSFRGGTHRSPLPPDLLDRLRAFASANGVSLFAALLTAWRALLGRLSGQPDFCIGVPTAERSDQALQDVVGLFLDTAAVRLKTDDAAAFRHLAARAGEAIREILSKPRPPLERLLQILGVEPDPSRSPLFQVFFVVQEDRLPATLDEGLTLTPRPLDLGGAKFDLTLSVELQELGAVCQWEYDSDLFDASAIERFARLFERLLGSALDAPDTPIAELSWMEPEELAAWRAESRGPRPPLPEPVGIHLLFAEQALKAPDAPAVRFDGGVWTYRDLHRRSNVVARRLLERGVGREDRVIVSAERSPEQLAALLGILKAGAAYAPFDPEEPAERLAFLITDLGACALVCGAANAEAFADCGLPVIAVGDEEEAEAAAATVDGSNLAYVLYTSGSTGRPKGVAVSHRAVARLLAQPLYADLGPQTRLLVAAPLSFDASTLEIWGALTKGGCCVLAPAKLPSLDALRWAGRQGGANACWLTAALFNLVLDEAPEALHPFSQVLTGGEALSVPHVRAFRNLYPPAQKRLVNGYGPTECVTFATSHDVETPEASAASIPIGRPLAHTTTLVLDSRMQPVPPGMVGDLYLGGLGLARGYWGKPRLTAVAFVPDPFASEPGERLYRTGDQVRRLPGGALDFVGRADRQVKIKGRRIELREVESAIADQPGVRSCAVVVDESGPAPAIVAYVTPINLKVDALESSVLSRLPRYMAPHRFVLLNSLPLTANGKLDRRRLPRLPTVATPAKEPSGAQPANEAERLLLTLWRELLRQPTLGVDDDVFQAGADSLIAIRLCERTFRRGFSLELTELLRRPTARGQARVLRRAAPEGATPERSSRDVPLSPSQRLFFSLGHDNPHQYNIAQWFRVAGRLRPESLREIGRALEERHDALRLRFDVATEQAWLDGPAFDAPVEWNRLENCGEPRRREALAAAAHRLQQSLRVDVGPLYRLAWFEPAEDGQGYLFAVVHHLAADGASMWILYADLAVALEQALGGRPVELPPPPAVSWRAWTDRLRQEAAAPALRSWVERWEAARPAGAHSLHDRPPAAGANLQGNERSAVRLLDADQLAIVQSSAATRGWGLPHLLGVAAANGVAAASQRGGLTVDWLSHGRDPVFPGADASRTVGYFTARTPVIVEAATPDRAGEAIRQLQLQIEQPPYGSLGFGLARYLADSPLDVQHGEVSFNFIGNLDRLRGEPGVVRIESGLDAGISRAAGQQRVGWIHVFADIEGGRLRFVWRYSDVLHSAATIESAADAAFRWLLDAAAACNG